MPTKFAIQWSLALGLDVDAVKAHSNGLQEISQKMADFIGIRAQQEVVDKVNNTMSDFKVDTRLVVENSSGVVVNEQTMLLADSFLVDAQRALAGTWPSAWEDNLKTPAVLLIAYLAGSAVQTNKNTVNWQGSLAKIVETFTNTHGPEKLLLQADELDQLLPQVMVGAASALLDEEGMKRFHETLKNIPNQSAPAPSVIIQLLLDSCSQNVRAPKSL